MGFGVWGLGFRVWGLGFRVWGLGFRVWGWGLGFRVWGLGFGVWGLGFRVWGLGLGVCMSPCIWGCKDSKCCQEGSFFRKSSREGTRTLVAKTNKFCLSLGAGLRVRP